MMMNLKAVMLLVLLGLPLMGGSCETPPPDPVSQCKDFTLEDDCEDNEKCKWLLTDAVDTPAACTGTPTPAPAQCPSVTEKPDDSLTTVEDLTACEKVGGCKYVHFSSSDTTSTPATCTGTPTSPAQCPTLGDTSSESDCTKVAGCTYKAAFNQPEKEECVEK